MIEDSLVIIPARGGSKGIPRKNVKSLLGRPLIYYTLDCARAMVPEANICVSTDDQEIKTIVEEYGVHVPFIRPPELATDRAGSREVLIHAINFYENSFQKVILLQPTSPFRQPFHVDEAYKKFHEGIDMVVSVKESKSNPYYSLFEENSSGFLEKCMTGDYTRRQDVPKVYEYNGAIYIINAYSLQKNKDLGFERVIKYEMDEISSIDLDKELDWIMAELLMKKKSD